MARGSRPGERRGGRAKGTPNATTYAVKEAIEQAFAGIGGVPALIEWARANPELFYSRVWTRILPREITADVHADVTTRTEVRRELVDKIVEMMRPVSAGGVGSHSNPEAAVPGRVLTTPRPTERVGPFRVPFPHKWGNGHDAAPSVAPVSRIGKNRLGAAHSEPSNAERGLSEQQ